MPSKYKWGFRLEYPFHEDLKRAKPGTLFFRGNVRIAFGEDGSGRAILEWIPEKEFKINMKDHETFRKAGIPAKYFFERCQRWYEDCMKRESMLRAGYCQQNNSQQGWLTHAWWN